MWVVFSANKSTHSGRFASTRRPTCSTGRPRPSRWGCEPEHWQPRRNPGTPEA